MIHPQTHRAREILAAVTRAYPHAWQQADHLRAARGKGLPDWPQWCYLPLHGAYAIVSGGGDNRIPFERSHHTGIVGALAAWRMGQQIIRYDETLYQSLCATPISGDLPSELLFRLPAWCLYIETPGLVWPLDKEDRPIHGFFVHLDWDERVEGHPHFELRILLDTADSLDNIFDPVRGLIPVPLILGAGTIEDSIAEVVASGRRESAKHGMTIPPRFGDLSFVADTLAPLISLVLYLCSESPDWDLEPPKNPPTVKTKHGPRTFAVTQSRIWDVGVRIGAALRQAEIAAVAPPLMGGVGEGATHTSPHPHLRRAHWHTYLTGTGRSKRVLKWLPPIPVNVETIEALPSTIRTVKGKPNP